MRYGLYARKININLENWLSYALLSLTSAELKQHIHVTITAIWQ